MKVRQLIIVGGIALSAIPSILLVANPAQAQQCSPKTTEGRYLVVCDGFVNRNFPRAAIQAETSLID